MKREPRGHRPPLQPGTRCTLQSHNQKGAITPGGGGFRDREDREDREAQGVHHEETRCTGIERRGRWDERKERSGRAENKTEEEGKKIK